MLHAFTASELQFQTFDPRAKIVQNIKFSLVGQNNDLSLKLNPNNQHESIVMLNFQNRAQDLKILKFYANRNNSAYPEKT